MAYMKGKGRDATPSAMMLASTFTPDLVNNASFETGWDGFTNWAGGTPTGVDRSTTQAFSGTTSVHRTLPQTSGTDVGTQFIYTTAQDRVWYRQYFYLTAAIDGILKFARWEGSASGLGGLFFHGGDLCWNFDVEVSAQDFHLTALSGLLNAWHWVEVDYWRNGDPSGWPSVAIWLDGTQITTSSTTPSPGYWSGGRLYAGQRNKTEKTSFCEWIGTLNGTPNNTIAADIYVDRIALSVSGRIGA